MLGAIRRITPLRKSALLVPFGEVSNFWEYLQSSQRQATRVRNSVMRSMQLSSSRCEVAPPSKTQTANNDFPKINSSKGPRFKTCTIHIGTEKTGTSAVQYFFSENRKALAKEGIYYPNLGSNGSQWELVAAAHDAPWKNQDISREFNVSNAEEQGQFRARLTRKLDQQFSPLYKADQLFISSEHFHSRLSTGQSLAFLKSFLSRWVENFKILIYFRRQDRVAVSLQSTKMKSASKQLGPPFPPGTGPSMRYFNYDDVYELWEGTFGAQNIFPRIYNENLKSNNGTIDDIIDLLGISRERKKLPPKLINASLSRPAYYFMEELNRQLPRGESGQKDPLADRMRRDLAEIFPGKHYQASRAEAEEFTRRFDQRNERLRSLAFPEHEGPLFDSSFSEYPETPEENGLTTEEAVEIAIALFRHARERHLNDRSLIGLLRSLVRYS